MSLRKNCTARGCTRVVQNTGSDFCGEHARPDVPPKAPPPRTYRCACPGCLSKVANKGDWCEEHGRRSKSIADCRAKFTGPQYFGGIPEQTLGTLTDAERQVVNLLAEAWNRYLDLPEQKPGSHPEMCAMINHCQEHVLARVGWRLLNNK